MSEVVDDLNDHNNADSDNDSDNDDGDVHDDGNDDDKMRDGGARIVANDHPADPVSSVLLRFFANGHL